MLTERAPDGPAPDQPVALQPAAPLDAQAFASVVANAPLVALDLIVEDPQGAVLLGLRSNPPAQGYWFVPGGRIRKNERLDVAFARISRDELGREFSRNDFALVDICEHFYDTDFRGDSTASTHYVVLVHRICASAAALRLPDSQHSRFEWMQPAQLLRDPLVHPHVKAYFLNNPVKNQAMTT